MTDAVFTSITATVVCSAAYNRFLYRPKPFVCVSPVTQSLLIIFPSNPILLIKPVPLLSKSPIFETYNNFDFASYKADSGALSTVSVCHNRSNECCADNFELIEITDMISKSFFMSLIFNNGKLRSKTKTKGICALIIKSQTTQECNENY